VCFTILSQVLVEFVTFSPSVLKSFLFTEHRRINICLVFPFFYVSASLATGFLDA
jgi:hypothetical protein